MAFTIDGTSGLTFPDSSTQTTRAVSRSGDTMTGNLALTNAAIISGGDGNTIGLAANSTGSTAGTGIRAWGSSVASWGGDLHYITDSRGVSGRHRFFSYNGSAWNDVATIDSAGRMIKPYQPAFRAGATGGAIYVPASTNINLMNNFDSGGYNIGGHYNTSNCTFTAPVAGRYLFWVGLFFVATIGYDRWYFSAPGYSSYPYAFASTGPDGGALSGSAILNLQANDAVTLGAQYGGATIYRGHSAWGGYFLG